ncbi:MAG: undecaprenyldiphospho-muramoylpentapeptide beta-N-acetylglucosaminyltransferase [Acetivibrionales bacterium]|jgi:UDP-N-acetylglucosamine--N-acetylmuramyl-(pentapeptide) pyrophosphoryl-undecaprenol N-acetylglucosamine transferase
MKYIISGGGTGGHINPGIAIAKEILTNEPDAEILFVGTKNGLEGKLVPREGFDIEYIDVTGLKRKFSIDTFKTIGKLFKSFGSIRKIFKEFEPDAVIGTGGYVCFPVVFSAALRKIPTLIHEQNAFPGISNKILARYADEVAISFEEARSRFKGRVRITLTGNPIRKDLFLLDRAKARENLGIGADTPLVVVFGGSLGAEDINECVKDMINQHGDEISYNLIFATGMKHYERVMRYIKPPLPDNIQVVPYIYNMGEVLAAADLAVTRGGAITISELSVLGVPSILIPSPFVAENHQEYNARALESKGAAVVILQNQLTTEILYGQIQKLIKDKELRVKMAAAAKKCGIRNAAQSIHTLIKKAISAKNK